MTAKLTSEHGRVCYAQRSRTIEPVFGQVKIVQGGGLLPVSGNPRMAASGK
jgi:hypothetical protein